jgi:predicted nucleic acid-binding protein
MSRVLVDAGPIVSLLQQRDEHHEWAREAFDAHQAPLYTCEAVLTEAGHLARGLRGGGEAAVLHLLKQGVLQLAFRLDAELLALGTLMARYANVPMSIADACLVRMTELEPRSTILTIDSHFRIYRRAGRHVIPVIMPPAR